MTNKFAIDIDGLPVAVEVVRRRVRHVYLKVEPGARLRITVPRRCLFSLETIIEQKRAWIARKVAEMRIVRHLSDDGGFLFHGQPCSVALQPAGGRAGEVDLRGMVATIWADTPRQRDRAIRVFLTSETLKYAGALLDRLTGIHGRKYQGVTTRQMRKWGYCSRSGSICLHWRLASLPEELAEYVVVHEYIHLLHFDHSPRFKSALAAVLPDCRRRELALRRYSLAAA
jgi:predicted metal-dependent hydrolase